MLLLASLAYAIGGLYMKQSDGNTRLAPTILFLLLFNAGALLQAAGMKSAQLGVSYVLVLGAEALLATLLSVLVLREGYSMERLAATTLILIGIAWLRRT
jgi:small multidrug resistance pump/quaternary ammonium compound-resistance protein SugE